MSFLNIVIKSFLEMLVLIPNIEDNNMLEIPMDS